MENNVPQRKQIRLKGYDYSQEGYYFITICTKNRECILSKIVGAHDCARIELKDIGKIAKKELLKTKEINENIKILEYIIMPDHVHMIISINENLNRAQSCAPTKQKTIGNIVRGIKSAISANIGYSIWQRNYYEHIIRNEKEYYQIIEYMKYNPIKWLNKNGNE